MVAGAVGVQDHVGTQFTGTYYIKWLLKLKTELKWLMREPR